MHKTPHLAAVMTPFPYSIERDAPLTEALALMEEHKVRHLPVTVGHEVVGVLAERDIHAALHRESSDSDLRVRDMYVDHPYIVSLDEPLDAVLLTMAERHIGSAIVTRGGKLSGMFTSVDACRSFGEYLREHFPTPTGDEVA
ncbi:MAG: CBS domain-containing protein [Thiogranum sp.]|nr:CBS domain-containing protein [Thiogranum sp.]